MMIQQQGANPLAIRARDAQAPQWLAKILISIYDLQLSLY